MQRTNNEPSALLVNQQLEPLAHGPYVPPAHASKQVVKALPTY